MAAERFRLIDRRLADARTRILVAQGLPRILVESVGLAALALVAWWLASREGGLAAALPSLAALGLGAQRLLPLLQTVNHSANALASAGSNPAAHGRDAGRARSRRFRRSRRHFPLPRRSGWKESAFTYTGRAEPALSGIDLIIRRGERIALVGPNGSGKSTLADLVMGLLEPSEGRLLVDGQRLARPLLPAWHRNIAHVPQAPFVADSSLAANIAFMDPAPDAAPSGGSGAPRRA